MNYGIIPKNKVNDVRCLWKAAFGDSETYMDFYFNNVFPENIVFGAYDGEKLASMIHLNPYIVNYCHELIPVHYIVGVATDEKYRNHGIMKKLLSMCLNYLEALGESFTYLMPAKESYYKNSGFELCEKSSIIPLEKLMCRAEELDKCNMSHKDNIADMRNLIIKTIDTIDEDMLSDFNKKLDEHYDLFVPRDMKYITRLDAQCKAEGGQAYILYDDTIRAVFGMMEADGAYELVEYMSQAPSIEEVISIYKLLGIEPVSSVEVFGGLNASWEKEAGMILQEGKGIMYKNLNNGFSNDVFYDKMLYINEIV